MCVCGHWECLCVGWIELGVLVECLVACWGVKLELRYMLGLKHRLLWLGLSYLGLGVLVTILGFSVIVSLDWLGYLLGSGVLWSLVGLVWVLGVTAVG